MSLGKIKAILFHQLFQSDETIAKIEEYLSACRFENMDPEEQEYYDYNLTNARLYQPQHELFSKEFIISECWIFFLEKPLYDSEFQPQNPASTQLIEHTWGFKGCPCWIGAYYEREDVHQGFLPTEFTAKGEVIAYTRIKQPFPVELGYMHRVDTFVSLYREHVPALYSSSDTGGHLCHLVGEIEYYLFDHPEKLYEVVPPWHPWYGPEHNETIRDYILDHFWIDAYTDHIKIRE